MTDWCLIAAWGGLLFAAVYLGEGGMPEAPSDPWRGQLLGLATMTIPVILYFALLERAGRGASVGKRLLGLRVVGEGGRALGFRASVARNAIKLLPWEAGHLVAHHAVAAGDADFPASLWLLAPLAMLGPVVLAVGILRGGRGLHDRLAGAQVVSTRA
jgi:uncharacterized RDD family membrane protein YckC